MSLKSEHVIGLLLCIGRLVDDRSLKHPRGGADLRMARTRDGND